MKKSILWAALALPTLALGQFSETFDDYTSGDYICVVSENFYPWTAGTEGTDGDAQVTDENAYESLNSLKLEQTAAAGGPADVLLDISKNEGNWSLTYQMFVEEGFSAYFNVQGTDAPGSEQPGSWQLNCAVSADGSVATEGPWGAAAPANVTIGEWFEVRVVVDLDQGLAKFWLAGNEVAQFPYVGNFSSVNLFAYGDVTTNGFYYVDEVNLEVSDVVLVGMNEAVASAFDFAPNPSNGLLQLTGVQQAQDLVVLDLMGREVARQSIEAGQQMVRFDVPEGVYLFGSADQSQLRKLVVRR